MNRSTLLMLFFILSVSGAVTVYAKGSQNMDAPMGGGQGAQSGNTTSGQQQMGSPVSSGSPSGTQSGTMGTGNQPTPVNTVQNQNQIKTQNQGEEQQLKVETKEQQGDQMEATTAKGQGQGVGSENSMRNLNDVRSDVAQKVQDLLDMTSASGGIGDQVKEWAHLQVQSQEKIQEHIAKVEGKSGILKALFGPDYKSLGELKKELAQNTVQLQSLEELQTQLTNQSDLQNITEMIALMKEEALSLQEKINLEQRDSSAFGWLVKLFAKY